MTGVKRSRAVCPAASPQMLAANADGGGGEPVLGQIDPRFQAANAAAKPRRAHIPARQSRRATIYLIELASGEPDADSIRGLKWLLKRAWRDFRLRCRSISLRHEASQ
jgi:hypothetical protein